MKIAICDDDLFWRKQLQMLLKDYISTKNKNISVSVYEHGENLIDDVLKAGGFDVYILDIMMPGINGIDLGLSIRKSDLDGKILYLTASENFAIDAFKAKAFNYILKPVEKDAFFQAMDDILDTKPEKSLIVKTKEGSVKLPVDSILYAELAKRTVVYHLVNGNSVESVTIRIPFATAVQDLLEDNRFVLCGASMIVNLYHITVVDSDSILFRNGDKAFIVKRASRELRSLWCDFWFNEEKPEATT